MNKIWFIFFSVWILILSGWVPLFGSAPGVRQVFQLQAHYNRREIELEELKAQRDDYDQLFLKLKRDQGVQEREIRRVLGYTRVDEMVFDLK